MSLQCCETSFKDFDNERNVNKIKLLVNAINKYSFEIVTNANERISSIQERVMNKFGMKEFEGKLIFDGEILDENKTVAECGLENFNIICVFSGLRGGMQIYIKNIEGKIYTIEVSKDDTIADLKLKLSDKSGFPPNDQRLVFKGKSLLASQTINDVGMESNCEVNLVIRRSDIIKVYCKVKDVNDIEIFVQTSQTVKNLKEAIGKETGMTCNDIEVIFDKRILSNNDLIKDCGIVTESKIDVIVKKNTSIILYIILGLIALLVAFEISRMWLK